MRIEEIEKMLLEFYDGKTTEKQEEELKLFFETEQVPDYLEVDKKLFLSFRVPVESSEVPKGLEDKLSCLIDAEANKERVVRSFAKRGWGRRWLGGVAAGLLLFLSLGYGLKLLESDARLPQDTFSDPEEAFKAVRLALIEISFTLNDGLEQFAETRVELTQINEEIKDEIQ